MGTIKDRNDKDLIEPEAIKKRWKECTELYKKSLSDPNDHNDVVTHPEPGIVKCKLKWTLGKTALKKATGVDGIPLELFKILKDDALNMSANLKNPTVAAGLKKVSLIPIPKKGSTKECSNHCTIAVISKASKVMLKILHARFQHYVN